MLPAGCSRVSALPPAALALIALAFPAGLGTTRGSRTMPSAWHRVRHGKSGEYIVPRQRLTWLNDPPLYTGSPSPSATALQFHRVPRGARSRAASSARRVRLITRHGDWTDEGERHASSSASCSAARRGADGAAHEAVPELATLRRVATAALRARPAIRRRGPALRGARRGLPFLDWVLPRAVIAWPAHVVSPAWEAAARCLFAVRSHRGGDGRAVRFAQHRSPSSSRVGGRHSQPQALARTCATPRHGQG